MKMQYCCISYLKKFAMMLHIRIGFLYLQLYCVLRLMIYRVAILLVLVLFTGLCFGQSPSFPEL